MARVTSEPIPGEHCPTIIRGGTVELAHELFRSKDLFLSHWSHWHNKLILVALRMASMLVAMLSIMSMSFTLPLLRISHMHTLHEVGMHGWVRAHSKRWWRHMTILLVVSLKLHGMHAPESLLLHLHELVHLSIFACCLVVFVFGFSFALLLVLAARVFLFVRVPLRFLLFLLGLLLCQLCILLEHRVAELSCYRGLGDLAFE